MLKPFCLKFYEVFLSLVILNLPKLTLKIFPNKQVCLNFSPRLLTCPQKLSIIIIIVNYNWNPCFRCMYSAPHLNTGSVGPLINTSVEMYLKLCHSFHLLSQHYCSETLAKSPCIFCSQFSVSFGPCASHGINKGEL